MKGLEELKNSLSSKKETTVSTFKKKNTGASLKEFATVKKKKEFDTWYIEQEKSSLLKLIISKLNTKNNTFLEQIIREFIENRVGEVANLTGLTEEEIRKRII